MRSVLLLAVNDLRLLSRDRLTVFWVFGFPLLFSLFFGAVLKATVSEPPSFALVVADESGSAVGREVVEGLRSSSQVELEEVSETDARRAVQAGSHLAMVHLPRGFGASPDGPRIRVAIDPSRGAESALVQATVESALEPAMGAARPEQSPVELVALKESGASGWDLVLPAAILWGLIGCAASFAVAMVAERTRGTLTRLRAAPIRRSHLLAAKALSCFVACALVACLLVSMAWLALDVTVGSLPHLGAAIASVAFCFVGITVLLGVVGKSEQSVAGAGWGSLVLMAMLGGAMVPVTFMPDWLRAASIVSPVRWSIDMLEGALWRGVELEQLASHAALLMGTGAMCFLLGVLRLRRTT